LPAYRGTAEAGLPLRRSCARSFFALQSGELLLNHPLQCRCGTLKGYVDTAKPVNRAVCYCKDCQAFAHYLGRPSEILDSNGGTDVIQTIPAKVTFTQGRETLACMRLSEKGLVRWYANCCNTPIGNTAANYRISFVGLIHNCLEAPVASLSESFGPVRMRSFTKNAKTKVKGSPFGMVPGILRLIAMMLRARLNGAYKCTPFFVANTGVPIMAPKILTDSEREAIYKDLG
jgi:Family of unknown function (DUF6151)